MSETKIAEARLNELAGPTGEIEWSPTKLLYEAHSLACELVDLQAQVRQLREAPQDLDVPEYRDHMPWMQAHPSDYTDGYNAGIAAAAVALKKMAEGFAQCPGGRPAIGAAVLEDGATRVLELMK